MRIKQDETALAPQRNLNQVVNDTFNILFGQNMSAVSIKPHLRRIFETHLLEFGMRNLVDSVLADSNTHPLALCKHRSGSIPFACGT